MAVRSEERPAEVVIGNPTVDEEGAPAYSESQVAIAEAPPWKHQLRMIVSSKAIVLCSVGVCCLNFVWCALKVYA